MFRQVTVISQDVFSEGGRELTTPCKRVAACGVLHNPHAGKAPIDDFTDLVDLSVEAGKVLTARDRSSRAIEAARLRQGRRCWNRR